VRQAKALIRRVAGRPAAEVSAFTAETLADRRVSREGQEGMRAFLERRTASWVVR
jgi:methylglutaconyl-CoA hydratase